ncbi:hypothetical protein ACHWQZ_G012053 [Mnemiopsis leidyi]
MCSETSSMEPLLKILDLVLVTDRLLEPWICDTLCDNIQTALQSSTSVKGVDQKLLDALNLVIHKDNIHNIKLKLQIVELMLRKVGVGVLDISDLLVHLDKFPAEVLDIFSLAISALPSEQGAESTHDIDLMASDSVMEKVKQCSKSPNVSIRKAAANFIAKYSSVYFKDQSKPIQVKLLQGFKDTFVCDVLMLLYESDYNGRTIANKLANLFLSHLLCPDNEGFKHLSKLRAHIFVFQTLEGTDGIEGPEITSRNVKAIEDSALDYSSTELHWQSYYRELFNLLISTGISNAAKKITLQVCNAKNIVILSVISRVYLSQKNTLLRSTWIQDKFVDSSILQKTMDVIYNDCSNLKEQRCALSLLNDMIETEELLSILDRSNVCHHYTKCDETNFKCFMSTLLTFLMECSSESFAMLTKVAPKLFKIIEYEIFNDSLQPQLTRLLIRRLLSSDSRIRDLALDFIGNIPQSCVDSSVLQYILNTCYTDEDFYIKSSALKVMSSFDASNLPLELKDSSKVTDILNKIVTIIEFDDSMVTISFFGFLQKHYHLISELIQNNLHIIKAKQKTKENGSSLDNGSSQNYHIDVDTAINEVCDSADCADVSLIAAYQERKVETSSTSPEVQLVAGIFRLLSSDRCDVERMKASIELMCTVLENLPSGKKRKLFDFMETNYFTLVESFNSPFLKQTIRHFNSVLDGTRVFSELDASKDQNLKTVLALLESTPDPDIVMDCY